MIDSRSPLFLFCLFSLWTGCVTLPFSLGSDQEEIVFDEETYNYHETRTLLLKKTPAILSSEGSDVSVLIQLPPHLPTQQGAFSRVGCQEIQFTFDSEFTSEGEKIPCQIACILDIQKNIASVKGSGIAIGRIGIFVVEQAEGTLVAQKILDEVTALDDQDETSSGHQQKKEFFLPVSLQMQTPYIFYIELLGKVENFSEEATCEVHMKCNVLEIRISAIESLSLSRSA